MDRVVFTVARGRRKYGEMALGLARSLALAGDRTPRAILTDIEGLPFERHFDFVFKPKQPRSALDKLLAFEYLDAQHVLSIDGDCLAFRKLDPIFEFAKGMPLAVQAYPITSGDWHGSPVEQILKDHQFESLLKFNGGMIYYENSDRFREILTTAQAIEADYDATGFGRFRGNASEEVCLTLAMAKHRHTEAIPPDMDFMSTAPGNIGKLEMDIRRGICRFVSHGHALRRVEPIIFHASAYGNFLIYWKQLSALEKLEKYADEHGPGYRSSLWKMRRSIERRILKYIHRKL